MLITILPLQNNKFLLQCICVHLNMYLKYESKAINIPFASICRWPEFVCMLEWIEIVTRNIRDKLTDIRQYQSFIDRSIIIFFMKYNDWTKYLKRNMIGWEIDSAFNGRIDEFISWG